MILPGGIVPFAFVRGSGLLIILPWLRDKRQATAPSAHDAGVPAGAVDAASFLPDLAVPSSLPGSA